LAEGWLLAAQGNSARAATSEAKARREGCVDKLILAA